MEKFSRGDKVRVRRYAREGTIIKPDGKKMPLWATPPTEPEQLWLVDIDGTEFPELVEESALELL